MRRLALILVALVGLVPAATAGGVPSVLTAEWQSGNVSVAWRNALTLEARGARAEVGRGAHVLTLSAARTHAVVWRNGHVRFVDLRTMHVSKELYVGGAWAAAGSWRQRDRVVLLVAQPAQAAFPSEVVVVDPVRFAVVRRSDLPGRLTTAARAGSSLVALVAPVDRIGDVRVAVVDARGAVRSASLGVQGGWQERRDPIEITSMSPGLAVAPDGTRAVVATPTAVVAVDLRNLAVTRRSLVVRRLQKVYRGWSRSAAWLAGDRVVVSGHDADGMRTTPAGTHVVDLGDGSARPLDAESSLLVRAGSTVLSLGTALRALDASGDERYRVEGRIRDVMVSYPYAYVSDARDRTRFRVVDVASGRVLATARTPRPTEIIPLSR